MIRRTWTSFVRLVGFTVIVFVFALASAESKACSSSRHDARSGAETSEHPPMKAQKFLWPARGHIVVTLCGSKSEGIDLVVADGAPIRAADAGVVAYAGDELKGWGNVIIIRHGGGFVSAYARVLDVRVKRGDEVSRGQIIAAAGRRPDDQPLLHFELRKHAKAVDPMRYLEARHAALGR
jgi:lipoprotein NlpD